MTSDLFSLAGKIILVTGASRGLGRAMAAAMAEAGGHVVLNGRDLAALDAAAAAIRDAGGAVEIEAFDVTDERAVKSAIAAIAGRHGRLDVLVGNAGIQHRQPLLEFATRNSPPSSPNGRRSGAGAATRRSVASPSSSPRRHRPMSMATLSLSMAA